MRLAVLLVAVLLAAYAPPVHGQALEDAEAAAFMAIVAAYEAGADTVGLVALFNHALALRDTGSPANVSEAADIFDEIIAESGILAAQATQRGRVDAAAALAKAALLTGAAAVVWVRGGEWFWRLWRRTKEGYVLE